MEYVLKEERVKEREEGNTKREKSKLEGQTYY
jgi:hypothetical protein